MHCAGCLLDPQQIESVVACEDAQLVLASAGSGKTLSLLAKIEYLHHHLGVPAEQILAISFTQKTVTELKERCSIKKVEIRTFHSLGNSILNFADYSTSKKMVAEDMASHFIRNYCEFLIQHDAEFAQSIIDFVLFFFSAPQSPAQPQSFAAKINYNRLFLRHALAKTPHEHIRAKEEQLIANWLFAHNLPYAYRQQYPLTDAKYQPTFTLKTPREIYIDCADIDRKNKSIFGSNYLKDLKWKNSVHRQNNTNYIVLPSWRWDDWSMFDYLKTQLQALRVQPTRQSSSELYRAICRDSTYQKELDGFYRMLQTFLSLHKNSLYDFTEIKRRLAGEDIYAQKRNALFLKIYQRIYRGYESFLFKTRQYDFADMINEAQKCVDDFAECAVGYKYILLDEVQDLSRNRFLLVRSILRKNPGCKLFAVGDDWQSIYRFTGSDLTLVRDFEKTFGLTTRRSFIEATHRFGEPTISLSCSFIERNPTQSHKKVQNIKGSLTPIYVILNKPERLLKGQDAASLDIILQKIISEQGYEKIRTKTIQVISRYNHDILRLDSALFEITENQIIWHHPRNQNIELHLEFCSMHKSKGITRDIVIVLNMNSDLMGMPATRESDPITEALLAADDSYPFAEERRLFYVAITRAREATYLIANRKNPSPFIFEISENIKTTYGKLCPKCHTGELIKKQGKHGTFFYCSNYTYGCNYLKRI